MPNEDLKNRIRELLLETIESAVPAIAEQLLSEARRDILSRLDSSSEALTTTVSTPPQISQRSAPAGYLAKKKSDVGSRLYPPHCLYPDCEEKHKGPRFTFMCQQHANVSKHQKETLLKKWKESQKPQ